MCCATRSYFGQDCRFPLDAIAAKDLA
jgi:hypothetical protein